MFHCLVIKVCCVCLSDSSFILSHLFLFVKHFFKFFSNIFELRFCCRFVDDLNTLSYLLSFVNYFFYFSESRCIYLFLKNNSFPTTLIEYHFFHYLSTYFLHKFHFFLKNVFLRQKPHFTDMSPPVSWCFSVCKMRFLLSTIKYSCKNTDKNIFIIKKIQYCIAPDQSQAFLPYFRVA